MQALLHRLGNPHLRLPVFHVAGTNGKGSTCATLEALLTARGHVVAKYTSPHLVEFRERFVVGGVACLVVASCGRDHGTGPDGPPAASVISPGS